MNSSNAPYRIHHVSFLFIINLDNSIWHAINMRINRVENTPDNLEIYSLYARGIKNVWVIFQICSLKRFEFEIIIIFSFFGERNKWESICLGSRIICIDWFAFEFQIHYSNRLLISFQMQAHIQSWIGPQGKSFVCSFVSFEIISIFIGLFSKTKKKKQNRRSINNSVCQMELKWHDKKTLAPLWFASSSTLSSSLFTTIIIMHMR